MCCVRRYHADGKAIVPFKCVNEEWVNPHWMVGEIYRNESMRCGPEDLRVVTAVVGG
jgi:hypothetical protein